MANTPFASLATYTSFPMNIKSNLLRAVLLTSVLSFVAPCLLICGGLTSFYFISLFPILQAVGHSGADLMLQFLATFGDGRPCEGFLVIGSTFALVGALFEFYAYYLSPRSS